jgi:hypothetical protein
MTSTIDLSAAILCGPPGVYTVAERECFSCKATGPHATKWLGTMYGYDHHCLTCRTTDADGHLKTEDERGVAYWDSVVAHALPTEMFERYLHAEDLAYDPALLAQDEVEAVAAWDAMKAEVRAHHESVRAAAELMKGAEK